MNTPCRMSIVMAAAAIAFSIPCHADTHYVWTNSPSPASPYADWLTAAHDIQSAIDASSSNDTVLVTNGVYDTGGVAVYGTMTNRVAITKPIIVCSVNGPDVTIIMGKGPLGDGAVRCAYVGTNVELVGFTLTNGHTRTTGNYHQEDRGGGVWCEDSGIVSNCVLSGNSADDGGGGAYRGTLNNCVIAGNSAGEDGGGTWSSVLSNCFLFGNSAWNGAGAYLGTLNDCLLSGNSATFYGGGANEATLNNCVISGNSARTGAGTYYGTLNHCTISGNSASDGGGTYYGTLNNCTLSGNSASYGGGTYYSTLNNCILLGNAASYHGGGAYHGTLNNCVLSGNSAYSYYYRIPEQIVGPIYDPPLYNDGPYLVGGSGGGAYYTTLNNCTLIGNSAFGSGGGSDGGTLKNCIIWYNSAPNSANYSGGTLSYCSTTPLAAGTNNISQEPLLASASHLSAESPCIGQGNKTNATGTDIDGEPWTDPPSIGCDEYHSGAVTGDLSVAIMATYTQCVVGFEMDFMADISGRLTASHWDFSDGDTVSNRPCVSHHWSTTGSYPVVLTAFNETYPTGICATTMIQVVSQAMYYVALSNPAPVAPYTSWATAATNIQNAIDAVSVGGAVVLVMNGVYESHAAEGYDGETINCVTINKPITVRSVNGPEKTTIKGNEVMRCAYVGMNAALEGFSLTDGHASSESGCGGGVWCHFSGVVSNCVLLNNFAAWGGGGVYGGTLNNCTLSGNSAYSGGGASVCTLNNCTLSENSASGGGGVYKGTLNNCALFSNSGSYGGGAYDSALNNCTLAGNSASYGAGTYAGTLHNCALSGNSASDYGGGAYGGTLNNCTLTGNSANYGGGTYFGTLKNCIIWYNSAPNESNYSGGTLSYCSTTPLAAGTNNISQEPLLASASHLSAESPCIGQGNKTNATGVDIDGEPWADPPSIGCDEYRPGAITGGLSVAIVATYTQVVVGFDTDFAAVIEGHASANKWDFGDGDGTSNELYVSHHWSTPGLYPLALTAFNETYPAGVCATTMIQVVSQAVYYVASSNPTPVAPYTSWATAATNIQDAIDAADVVGALILVSNGVYDTGGVAVYGVMTNRVAINKPITVRSVNGPAATIIMGKGPRGNGAVRCVYMGRNAVLEGFTLTNGCTLTSGDEYREGTGGGVWCANGGIVSNCTLSGNFAGSYGGGAYGGTLHNCVLKGNSANCGGGASGGTLNNCTLSGNSASWGGWALSPPFFIRVPSGGGADYCTLNNCTLSGNSADFLGGGADGGVLNNCIIWYNSAPDGSNYYGGTLSYCSTTPLADGPGNITNAPSFVGPGSGYGTNHIAGNYRLQPDSPCINAGNNGYVTSATDLDSNPRIQALVVDIGAYESPYAPIDASATGHGSISPVGRIGVLVSNNQSFTMTVPPGYPPMRDVKVDGVSIGPTNSYTFVNLTSNHTIEAIFWGYPGGNGYGIAGVNQEAQNSLTLSWTGTNGWKYTLQKSLSLLPPVWSNVAPYTNVSGIGPIVITNDMGIETQMYYRLKAVEEN